MGLVEYSLNYENWLTEFTTMIIKIFKIFMAK